MDAKRHHYKFKIGDRWCLDPWSPTESLGQHINHVLDLAQIPDDNIISIDQTIETIKQIEFLCPAINNGQLINGCSMNLIGDELIILGGYCKQNKTNEMTRINIISQKAQETPAEAQGFSLPPCAFHFAFNLGQKLLVVGGEQTTTLDSYFSFSTTTGIWSKHFLDN